LFGGLEGCIFGVVGGWIGGREEGRGFGGLRDRSTLMVVDTCKLGNRYEAGVDARSRNA
jgi:hypothetical protein